MTVHFPACRQGIGLTFLVTFCIKAKRKERKHKGHNDQIIAPFSLVTIDPGLFFYLFLVQHCDFTEAIHPDTILLILLFYYNPVARTVTIRNFFYVYYERFAKSVADRLYNRQGQLTVKKITDSAN